MHNKSKIKIKSFDVVNPSQRHRHTYTETDKHTHARALSLQVIIHTYYKAVVATNSIIYCGEQVHFCSQVGSGQFVTMRRYEMPDDYFIRMVYQHICNV